MAQPPFPCMVEALSTFHPVVKQEHQEGRERPERLGIAGRLVGELVVRGFRGHHPSGNPQTETGLVHDGDWELWMTWATCDAQLASVQGVEGVVNRCGQTYGIVTGVVIIPICMCWPPVTAMMPRERVGSISSTCPTTCYVANGNGTYSARCVRRSPRTPSSSWWIGVSGRIPTVW